MKKNANVLSIAYFTFILLILFSGSLRGIAAEVVYFLAFICPIFAVILFTDRELPKMREFSLPRDSKMLFLPTVFPLIFLIAALSFLTSWFISLFGATPAPVDLGGGLLFALFYNAVLPSILEELLFRYLPMRYLAPDSPTYAVIFSALFFALAHHSFFSMPYAFLAGAAFMTVNIICQSALPSVILHFLNNAISILWMFFFAEKLSPLVFLTLLLVPAIISVVFLIKLRGRFAGRFSVLFEKKERFYFTPLMLLATLASVVVAILEILT